VLAGDWLNLHVWSEAPQIRIDLYRYPFSKPLLGTWRDCQTAGQAMQVGSYEADWSWPAYATQAPAQSGVYIAIIVEGDGQGNVTSPVPDLSSSFAFDSRLLFVVRSRTPGATARILYKLPVFTYHAYNTTGGGCFYDGGGSVTLVRPGGGTGGDTFDPHGSDRKDPASPYQTFEHWDAKFITWLETEGYTVDYCTDFDIHTDPLLLPHYRLMLSVGHDEYWSDAVRANVTAFRDAGGNLAFFSGNTCWWHVTFTTATVFHRGPRWFEVLDSNGRPMPENQLTGVSYRNAGAWYNGQRQALGYTINCQHWTLPGLARGDVIGGNDEALVGYECDGALFTRDQSDIAVPTGEDGTPDGFTILGLVELTQQGDGTTGWYFDVREPQFDDRPHAATMGIYETADGAQVFTSGCVDWARVLASGDGDVGRITRMVLDRFSAQTPGLAELGNVANLIACDGFFSADNNLRHAVIATGDGNIQELPYSPAVGQLSGIRTFLNGVVDVGGFTSDDDQFRHVVVVDFQGNVWDIAWDNNNQPITQILVNIPNASRVAGFYTPDDQRRHAIVGTSDGDVIEVYYRGILNANPQMAPLGRFDGLVDVGGFFSPDDGYRHAMVGTADGTITEIFYSPDFGIFQTAIAAIPDLARVSGYYADGDKFFNRRVQALTNGGRIHEVRYSPAFGVMRAVLFNPGVLVDLGGFYSNDDNYSHSILARFDGGVKELFFVP
jgi:hypothetical protein